MIAGLSLTPRQLRLGLDLLTALVVISVAFALAGLTWRIAGHAGTGAVTVPSGASGPSAAVDVAPAIALAPFGAASSFEGAQPTTLQLELKGVIAVVPASLSTAFIAVAGAAPENFGVGDTVGGARIEAILRDRVMLSNGGANEYLAFPDPAHPQDAAGGAPAPVQNAVTGAPPAAAPPVNAASLIARLDATPQDGGYRIGENPPPGLMPGDVVQSVNGTALSDARSAQAAFAAAASSGTAQITIVRGGKPLTISVPTR